MYATRDVYVHVGMSVEAVRERAEARSDDNEPNQQNQITGFGEIATGPSCGNIRVWSGAFLEGGRRGGQDK